MLGVVTQSSYLGGMLDPFLLCLCVGGHHIFDYAFMSATSDWRPNMIALVDGLAFLVFDFGS